MSKQAAETGVEGCEPTCSRFGYHAFNCRNHPGRVARPRHCTTCACPKENR